MAQSHPCNTIDDAIDYINFLGEYRVHRQLPLGGKRIAARYPDPTSQCVLSVGSESSRSQLPCRMPLSTFKISYPITSYGCIVKCNERYLLIKRSDTIEYLEFIRGNYRESQLFFLIKSLTREERDRILKYRHDFDVLWSDLMTPRPDPLMMIPNSIYSWAKNAFGVLSPDLEWIFDRVKMSDPEGKNMWLFPKGRIDVDHRSTSDASNETPWDCAKREFNEETNGLFDQLTDIKILQPDPIQEYSFGTNSKNYTCNYFILESSSAPEPTQFERRQTDIRNVSIGESEDIRWVPYEELGKYLTETRLELARKAHIDLQTGSKECRLNDIWLQPLNIGVINSETDL